MRIPRTRRVCRATIRRGTVVLLLAVAAAVPATSPATAASQQVRVTDNAFVTPGVAVAPGESVTWKYMAGDGADHHNVNFEAFLFTSPPGPTLAPWEATRTFPTEGVYRYFCQEHGGPGGGGMSGIVYVNATGTLPPNPPSASFTVSSGLATVGQVVTFDASASSDPGGGVVRYEWDLDGNGTFEDDRGTQTTTTMTYPTAGVRTVRLRVTDAAGLVATTTRSLTVTNVPVASFTVAPTAAQPGQSVSFDGSASSDPDGTIARYQWDLDGNGDFETDTGTTASIARVYPTAASLTIALRVTDNLGVTGVTTRPLQVSAPAPPPAPPPPPAVVPPPAGDTTAPVARLAGATTQKVGGTVVLTVSCSSEDCTALVAATVKVPKVGTSRARTFKLRGVTVRLAKGARRSVGLKLSAVTRSAILRALRARKGVSASFTITVSDTAANKRSLKRSVKFRR